MIVTYDYIAYERTNNEKKIDTFSDKIVKKSGNPVDTEIGK